MKDQLTKDIVQSRLFAQIEEKLPDHLALVDVVSDCLGVSSDAAYRRIRADKILDLNETALLCRKFNLSADNILDISTGMTDYKYTPLDLQDIQNYYIYMQRLSVNIERLRKTGGEIILSATDVPVFHFLAFKDLTFFKLFAWTNSIYECPGTFEDFQIRTESVELLDCYSKIDSEFRRLPSTEVWTQATTDTFLKLLSYHYELGDFSEKNTVLSLCEQFIALLDHLEQWSDQGYKDSLSTAPFRLYLSEIDLENNFILLKQEQTLFCILKLFTINSLNITDKSFCRETEGWLKHLTQRATLISGASEKERHKFFNNQRLKVRFLMDKICKDQY